MTLTEQVAKRIITKLLKGEDYRIEVITLINAEFSQYAIDFFKLIVNAKLNSEEISIDWYKHNFINADIPKADISINSGLNMFNSTQTKNSIDNTSVEKHSTLYYSIEELVESELEFDCALTIKLNNVSFQLSINESLIVINTLAVKRAALSGGLWSTAGKRVEKHLMETLCRLYSVPNENYKTFIKSKNNDNSFAREIDFYLLKGKNEFKCEVKLMGKGNPESADVVIARASNVFIADKLSNTNKNQLDSLKIEWVELRSELGFRKFKNVLENLNIPHKSYNDANIDKDLDEIFKEIFH